MRNIRATQVSRRTFLGVAACTAAGASRSFAEHLIATPRVAEGPFYPDKPPLDTDNDLLLVNDAITPAVGEITHLSGRILGPTGSPIRNAFVEIWQVDGNGVYLHSADRRRARADDHFQGYGRFLTDAEGRYYFRTIKPVPYPGRTPHIHYAVSKNGRRVFTTQLFIKGHPQNDRDFLFRGIRDPKQRELLLADFTPIADSKIGELAATFDVVLGATPEDPEDSVKGGVGKPERMDRRPRTDG